MKKMALAMTFVVALFAGYASTGALAGIFGTWCDPGTITNGCPMTCGLGINGNCPVLGGVCKFGNPATPLRKLCQDAFFQSCVVGPCPANYSCGGLGIIPCGCPEPPGTC
jgi:hypothetical protein